VLCFACENLSPNTSSASPFPITHHSSSLSIPKVAPCAAQFGVGANRRNKGGGASSFEDLNKLAAERANKEDAADGLGLSAMMGDVEAMMKDMDPNTLQELMMEGQHRRDVVAVTTFVLMNCFRRYERPSSAGDGEYRQRRSTQSIFSHTSFPIVQWNARGNGGVAQYGS